MPHPGCFNPGKGMVSIVQGAGWAPGTLWTGAEDPRPHQNSIPGPSSPSVYRLRCPGPHLLYSIWDNCLNVSFISQLRKACIAETERASGMMAPALSAFYLSSMSIVYCVSDL